MALLDQLDASAVQLFAVEFVQRVVHVIPASELDNALSRLLVVRVGIGDLSTLTHEVLKILPRGFGRQVLHD